MNSSRCTIHRSRWLPVTRLALVASILAVSPWAPAAVLKQAELTAVVNDVKLVEPGKGERAAGVRDVVAGTSSVKTGIKSRAELLFQDKTLTRLGANTLFSFDEGTRELELERGTVLLQIPKGICGAKIRTAAVTAAVTGTTIMLEYTPVAWKQTNPPGVSPLVVAMAPERCALELQHPSRNYSPADLAEMRRKAALVKKGSGFVKVMVLEGTLRLYLNNRVGESVLVTAGKMIILNPNATTIPPGVEFDIARLAQTSLLVNNKNWGGSSSPVNMGVVTREISTQEAAKRTGELSDTGLRIEGGGTTVTFGGGDLYTQLDRRFTASTSGQPDPEALASSRSKSAGTGNVPIVASGGGSEPPPPPPRRTLLAGFKKEGSETLLNDEAPPTSSEIAGHAKILSELLGENPGDTPVLPKSGSSFIFLSNGDLDGEDEPVNPLTASKLLNTYPVPASSTGEKSVLSFDYRFLTDEIGETGNFGDRFDVRVESGTQSMIYSLQRDALDPGGANTPTPITQLNVGGFRGGTDWLPFALDLSPFAGQDVRLSLVVFDRGDPVVDSAVTLGEVSVGDPPANAGPGLPGTLSLNLDSVTFGTGSGEMTPPNLEGLAPVSGSGPAADVGSLFVTSPGDITLNAPLNASTGANGPGTTLGGKGGTVSFRSTSGEIAINSTLQVSESATATGKASKVGGSIALHSEKTTGVAISVSNTGELLALVNAGAALTAGGQISLNSKGGAIRINGKLNASSHGTITVENQGPAGLVELTAAQIAASVVKIRALGDNGVLRIGGGSISADTMLKLYAGGSNGTVDFVDNVSLSGASTKTIAGQTVNISDGKVVTVNGGAATVFSNNANYTGSGGNGSKTGTFGGNGATTLPFNHASKPPF